MVGEDKALSIHKWRENLDSWCLPQKNRHDPEKCIADHEHWHLERVDDGLMNLNLNAPSGKIECAERVLDSTEILCHDHDLTGAADSLNRSGCHRLQHCIKLCLPKQIHVLMFTYLNNHPFA